MTLSHTYGSVSYRRWGRTYGKMGSIVDTVLQLKNKGVLILVDLNPSQERWTPKTRLIDQCDHSVPLSDPESVWLKYIIDHRVNIRLNNKSGFHLTNKSGL